MASACRAVAAALVKSFPPAVAAPFCMLVDGDLLRQHAEFRGVDRRKTFQESPRKAHTAATGKRGSVASVEGSCAGSPEKFSPGRCRKLLHAGRRDAAAAACRRLEHTDVYRNVYRGPRSVGAAREDLVENWVWCHLDNWPASQLSRSVIARTGQFIK